MVARHIVITGASSGIGAALARRYADSGVRLSLAGRDPARLGNIASECQAKGAQTLIYLGDVADGAAMAQWLAACDAAVPVDMVIANAGIGGDFVLSGKSGETLEAAGRIIATNVLGVMNSIIPLLPAMIARRAGAIVMVGSLAAFIDLPDAPVYCASKAAIRSYGHGLRRLMAPHGVQVTIVSPGFIDTPMSASLAGPRPLLWTAERAARHIAQGVARGRREIIFPFALALAARFANLLPTALLDRILIQNRTKTS